MIPSISYCKEAGSYFIDILGFIQPVEFCKGHKIHFVKFDPETKGFMSKCLCGRKISKDSCHIVTPGGDICKKCSDVLEEYDY